MILKKIGHIFSPDGEFDWMQSHATVPTPFKIGKEIYRIFFSTRNNLNQNQVGYVDININNPTKVINISEEPVIKLGKLGYFDCDGIYGTCIVKNSNKINFYFHFI